MKCEIDIHKVLYANTLIYGGSTMCPGIANRLENEIKAITPPTMSVHSVAPPVRKYGAWIGGSIITSYRSFQSMWISKHKYEDFGSSITHHN